MKKIKFLFMLFSIMCLGTKVQAQNNALNFDGIDDYVSLDSVAPILAGDNSFTIEFWMKADKEAQTSSIRTTMFGINQDGNGFNRLLIILGGPSSQTGQLMIYTAGAWGSSYDYLSSQVIGDNICHHIAISINNGTGYVYIDGVLDGTFAFNTTLAITDSYSLGQEYDQNYATSQFYNGDLDEVRVWNTARDSNEIQNNMNSQLSGNETGLVVYYNCNQGIAGGNNTSESSLTNSTIYSGLDGQFNNIALNGSVSNFVQESCPIISNNVLNFDGIDDYVSLDTVAPILAGDSTFSIEFWMKADFISDTARAMFSINGPYSDWSTQHAYTLLVSATGDLELWVGGQYGNDVSKYYSQNIIADNQCHHIALTVSSQIVYVYIDGVLKITANPHPHVLTSNHLYSLGQEWDGWAWWSNNIGQPTQFYNGDLDEIRIWNTTRTQADIQSNMNNQLNGNETGLVVYYNCDQGISGGNNTSEVSLTNSSTYNGLDGQFHNLALNGSTSNFILNSCSTLCNTDSTTQIIETCDSYTWNGVNYTQSGIYIDTLTNSNGCDSIITLDLTINLSSIDTTYATSCDSYEWNGNIFTQTGIYTDSLQNVTGCDSILVLNLTIYNSFYSDTTIVACDSYKWNGADYTQTGIYTDSLTTVNGCDSIVTLDLTINHSSTDTTYATSCNSYEWNGNTYTQTGIYTDSLQSVTGCDSILVLNLTLTNDNNNALNFDGIDDYVSLDTVAPILAGDSTFSVEFWMKTDFISDTARAMFSINGPYSDWSTQHAYTLLVSATGDLELWVGGQYGNDVSKYNSQDIIADNQCHHIALTVSKQIVYVYIDGILKITANPHPQALTSDHLYSLGQEWDGWAWWSNYVGQPTQFYNGDLDEVRIWNTTRTQAEIQNNMNSQLSGNETGLVVYYNCNQGVAGGNNTSEVSLTNSSTYAGLEGQFHNMTLNGPVSNFVVNSCCSKEDSTANVKDMILDNNQIKVYPNPTSTSLTIELNGNTTNSQIRIFDMSGKLVTNYNLSNHDNLINIDVNNLESGVYLITIIDPMTNEVKQTKFVKQ